MRISLKYLLGLSALSLAAASTPVHASTVTIDFGTATGGSPTLFTSFTEPGTSVSATNLLPGHVFLNPNQGDPAPGLTGGGATVSLGGSDTSGITVSDAGTLFLLDDFSVASIGSNSSYTVDAYNAANTLLYTFNGSDSFTSTPTYTAFATPVADASVLVNHVTISLTDSGSSSAYYLDDVVVTTTPEPSSLILLGSGLIAIAGAARRRFAR